MMQRMERLLVACLVGMALYGMRPACAVPKPAIPYYAISGDIEAFTPTYFKRFLDGAEASGAKEVHIDIQSPGGNAEAALQMFTDLRASGLHSVCTVYEMAASGAFLVLQACSVRIAMPESQLVTHRVYATVPSPRITVEDAIKMASELGALALRMDILIAQRLGMSRSSYAEKVKDGENWEMTPEEALAAHAVDIVLPALDTKPTPAKLKK